MVQNICKKFLLLLMFSLLRVDVLCSESFDSNLHSNEENGNENNEHNEEKEGGQGEEMDYEVNGEEEKNNEEMNYEDTEGEEEKNNEEYEEQYNEEINAKQYNKEEYYEEEQLNEGEEEQQNSKKGEYQECEENINNINENNSINNEKNFSKYLKEESYRRPNNKLENLGFCKNERFNLGNTNSYPFWGDNEYANDPEEKVMGFIKKEVKQEEIEKNNEKTLVVLDILKDVNDSFKEKKSKEEEARINNQLTSINNNQAFEEDININDDVNTIREVNSILDKRIEKNPELKTLKDKQRKKDVNGAINSYYELYQAESEIEKNFENERKKEQGDIKKTKKEEEEKKKREIAKKIFSQCILEMKIKQYKKLLELEKKRRNLSQKFKKIKNPLSEKGTKIQDEIKELSSMPLTKEESMFVRLKNQEEQEKYIGEIEKKFNEKKEEQLRMSNAFDEGGKRMLEEIKEREKERFEILAKLNKRKEKVINGLKEVEERIMTLSPSSEELNSAIGNIIKEREKKNKNEAPLDGKFLKDLKDKVKEEQKNYTNERVFQEFENNIKVLDKYLKSNTEIKKRDEKIMGVDIKDQNKISKTQNKESKDQNKISEEKTDGFGEYIDKSTDKMKKMVEENTFINDEKDKNEILKNIVCIKQICEDINENQRKDPYIKENGKNEIISSCKNIEYVWKKCNNKENYNNKQKGTTPEKNIEEEGRVLKGQQHRKDKFLEKLHRFENFVENCDLGTTQIEQSENSIEDENTNKKVLKEEEALKEEYDENILNKKEEILNEEKKEENKEELINIKEDKEEIIDTKEKEEEIENKNINENNNIEEKEKSEELINTNTKNKKDQEMIKIDNIEKEEKEAINNQKRSTEEIISKGHLFEDDEKEFLLRSYDWHFDEDGKIILGKDEEEIENDKDKNDNDKNDDKSLINLIESPAYKDMKNRALMKGKGKEKQKDEKNGYDNINNAESVLKEELQLDRRDKMKKFREVTKKQFFFYGETLKEQYSNLFKKNDNYIKTVNNVVKKEEEKYEKLINTWKKEISKISSLILLRGFGRFAVSFLFSTINSIMQFERKDVIGPYFSFYTLSFGKIVQPSFLRKNIYIDISLSLLSLLIFSAVDSKIDRYYLLKYKITSPLCRFLSLIKYTTNAFNININFFVNEDFYMSFNIMSIFDSIISWYWFNNFKEQVNKSIIEECDKKIKSIKKGSKPNYEKLETMLSKQGERLIKRRKLNFFRRMLASDLVKERIKEKEIEKINQEIKERQLSEGINIDGNNEKTIFKKNRNSNDLEKIEEEINEEDNNKDSDDNIDQL